MKRTITAAVAGVALAGFLGAGVATAAGGTGPGQRLGEILSGLVGDGTITQQQADEVAEALTEAREDAWAERQQRQSERRAEVDALLQDTLGMDAEALREQLRDGRSLLEIAGDSADDLAAGALELLAQHLDEAVEQGRLTSDQAEDALTRAQERTQAWLDGQDPGPGAGLALLMGPGVFGPEGHPGPGHMGRGPGMGAGMGAGRGWHGPMGGPGWDGEGGAGQPAPSGSGSSGAASTSFTI